MMDTISDNDRAFWQSLVDANYHIPEGFTAQQLTPQALAFLGSTESHVREEFGFEMLAEWIGCDSYYTADDLRAIGKQMEENLANGLGESGTDSVFLRAFSALILEKVIEADNRALFLSREEVLHWLNCTVQYLLAERDLRGHVPVKGWAHAIAHTSDVLLALAMNRHLQAPELEQILQAAADRFLQPGSHVYLYREDERMAYAVIVALKRNLLDLPTLTAWIDRIINQLKEYKWFDETGLGPYQNTRSLLRNIYFMLLYDIRAPHWFTDKTLFDQAILVRDPLLQYIGDAVRMLGGSFYKSADPKDE